MLQVSSGLVLVHSAISEHGGPLLPVSDRPSKAKCWHAHGTQGNHANESCHAVLLSYEGPWDALPVVPSCCAPVQGQSAQCSGIWLLLAYFLQGLWEQAVSCALFMMPLLRLHSMAPATILAAACSAAGCWCCRLSFSMLTAWQSPWLPGVQSRSNQLSMLEG